MCIGVRDKCVGVCMICEHLCGRASMSGCFCMCVCILRVSGCDLRRLYPSVCVCVCHCVIFVSMCVHQCVRVCIMRMCMRLFLVLFVCICKYMCGAYQRSIMYSQISQERSSVIGLGFIIYLETS